MKIFKIGDFVKFNRFKGKVIDIIHSTPTSAGYCKIAYMENGEEKHFTDYYYIFELDIQEARNQKINNLLS